MISDEQSRAAQEVAKTTGQFLELSGKAGAFFAKIVGEPVELMGEIFADRIRLFKYRNLCAVADKVEAIHRRRRIDGKTIEIPPRLAFPMIESAALEDNEVLQDIWAKLIANSTAPHFKQSLHPGYIEVVKQLSPDEAIIISECAKFSADAALSFESPVEGNNIYLHSKSIFSADGIWDSANPITTTLLLNQKNALPVYLDNLIRLRILQSVEARMKGLFLGMKNEHLTFSAFGSDFVRYCITAPD